MEVVQAEDVMSDMYNIWIEEFLDEESLEDYDKEGGRSRVGG